jgi:hypothetical protein
VYQHQADTMAKFNKNRYLGSHRQVHAMKTMYPQFTATKVGDDNIRFVGELHVKKEFPPYQVSITYRGSLTPQVKVLRPVLVADPPHFYQISKTLCLYKPENWSWHKGRLVANEIVSWTAGWLYFYLTWLETGIWEGPEALHNNENLNPNEISTSSTIL